MRRVVLAFDGDEIDQAVQAHPAGAEGGGAFCVAGAAGGNDFMSLVRRGKGLRRAARW